MAKKIFRFGIFYNKEEKLWGAIGIDDTTYLTTGKDRDELLENIEDVIQILEGENTYVMTPDDYSIFCCYWVVEYDTESKKAKIVEEVNELE